MRIKIMSREKIEDYFSNPVKQKVAVISLTDYNYHFAELVYQPEYLLQLKVDDVDYDVFEDELGEAYSVEDTYKIEEQYHMMSNEQAKTIAGFVDEVLNKVDVIICQCEHGQSRSAAVGAAIMEFKVKSAIKIFADPKYYPNKFIYWKVLNALNEVRKCHYKLCDKI